MADGLWDQARPTTEGEYWYSRTRQGHYVYVSADGTVRIPGGQKPLPGMADAILACLAAARGQQTKEGQ